jgi:competence protein ComGC
MNHGPQGEGKSGIDLSGWLIVAFFIGLLAAAVAIGKFIKSHNTASKAPCIAYLKMIDGALQQWALENKKTKTNEAPPISAILDYFKGSVLPSCPEGGTYRLGQLIGDPPVCSLSASHGHSL